MNRIKTEERTALTAENLENLLLISLNGPSSEQIDFDDCIEEWKKAKTRRRLI